MATQHVLYSGKEQERDRTKLSEQAVGVATTMKRGFLPSNNVSLGVSSQSTDRLQLSKSLVSASKFAN